MSAPLTSASPLHEAFCAYGRRCDAEASRLNLAEGHFLPLVTNACGAVTALALVALERDKALERSADASAFVTADHLAAYGDRIAARLGTEPAVKRMHNLGSALASVFERHFPEVDMEVVRLRQNMLSTTPRTSRIFRLQREDVPPSLRPLLDTIAARGRLAGGGQACRASPANRERLVLRFLASLSDHGVQLATLDETTLVTAPHLTLFLKNKRDATEPRQALYELKSALGGIGADVFARLQKELGSARNSPNTDFETFVPDEERRLLETALARPHTDRIDDEPPSLEQAIARKLKRSYGAWHRVLQANGLTGVWPHDGRARHFVEAFEAAHRELSTATLIARLVDIKSAVRRIEFERQRAPAGPRGQATRRSLKLEALDIRIRALRFQLEARTFELPEGLSPTAIETLGSTMIEEAEAHLKGLRSTKTPYRSLRKLAETYRDGLVFLVFSAICLRVGDLSRLLIDAGIMKKGHVWVLHYVQKNGSADFHVFSPEISKIIDVYHDQIRSLIAPVVPGVNDKVFWMSRSGESLSLCSFQEAVPRHTLARLGFRATAHFLRAIEASLALQDEPEDPNRGAVLLRHKSPRTTRAHYQSTTAKQLAAARRPPAMQDGALVSTDLSKVHLGRSPRRAP